MAEDEAAGNAALERLLADGIDVVAARLLAETFGAGAASRVRFSVVRDRLAALAGVGRLRRVVGTGAADYAVGLEILLLWERARLAARTAGDGGSTWVHLLRPGQEVLRAPDVTAAALAAIRASGAQT